MFFGDKYMATDLSQEAAVHSRYSAAAQARETTICLTVDYDRKYLEILPSEIIDKDYGCGDPSRNLRPGETVLDLGCGGGKICYIASQMVGATGKVIGVDISDGMVELARKYRQEIGDKLGYHNVEFHRARIQDLKLDLEKLDEYLQTHPVSGANAFMAMEQHAKELRRTQPLVPSESIDVVVSNGVINLVDQDLKKQLFQEMYRVLKSGGRAVISDIVSDEVVPMELQNDPVLWSGCIAGCMTEDGFLQAFVDAGFHGVQILKRDKAPWQTVAGIEFRSYTVEAFKGKEGPCLERNQAVVYKGPFSVVIDDDNHRFERGKRYAVCEKTYTLYQRPPYSQSFEFIDPIVAVENPQPFPCGETRLRHPRESKGVEYCATVKGSCCGGKSCEEAKAACCEGVAK